MAACEGASGHDKFQKPLRVCPMRATSHLGYAELCQPVPKNRLDLTLRQTSHCGYTDATRITMSSKKDTKAKALTKAQMLAALADRSGLTKSQVGAVLEALDATIAAELKAGRPVAVPGLVKITTARKAATAARPGINPFTGASITIKAKPARKVIKVRALKALKDKA